MTKFIEIGIAILVDIFKGIKKHCEKRTHRYHEYQDSKDATVLPPREMWNVVSSYPDPNLHHKSLEKRHSTHSYL